MTGVEIHALAGAYALDAVDDIERAAFDRHLRECSACAVEVAELRETAARLTDPVATAPPAELRDSVLGAIANTPQARARRAAPSGPAALTRWRRWTAAAVAAGIMAVGVGTATWVVSQQEVKAEREQNARVQAVLGAPDARLVASDMAGGRVTLVVSPSRDAAVAVLDGLAPPGSERLYQLWMIGGTQQQYRSVGKLPVAQGSGTTYIKGLGGAPTFGVSRERGPDGSTSGRPSTDIAGLVNL
jgi:anti-sigma-K factor RskA